MLKQTLIAGAALAMAAVPAFAMGGFTVNHVSNHAHVHNTTVTVANTGFNLAASGFTAAGGDTKSGDAYNGGKTGATYGASAVGASVQTGAAGAESDVTNVVNTTVVHN